MGRDYLLYQISLLYNKFVNLSKVNHSHSVFGNGLSICHISYTRQCLYRQIYQLSKFFMLNSELHNPYLPPPNDCSQTNIDNIQWVKRMENHCHCYTYWVLFTNTSRNYFVFTNFGSTCNTNLAYKYGRKNSLLNGTKSSKCQ